MHVGFITFTTFLLFSHLLCVQISGLPTSKHVGSDVYSRAASAAILNPGDSASVAFLWTSIGLAVFTAFLQGLVTSLASMTETSNSWTFRFRLATVEHWWWTVVSTLLLVSLSFSVLSFASGNSNETISILVLSTTTLLAIVRYLLPAWRSRAYIHNRLLAWTGPSRTAVKANLKGFLGNKTDWAKLAQDAERKGRKGVPSDDYGWHLIPVAGIKLDPTDILTSGIVTPQSLMTLSEAPLSVYYDGEDNIDTISLLWGAHLGFRPRVSRSVSAVPINLLRSQPFTNEGFAGEGLCLAMGILGRNKGLSPTHLVFNQDRRTSGHLETHSAWYPRPAKTLRSYYHKVAQDVYGSLSEAFVSAAVELSLILMDAEPGAIGAWLNRTCEQQSIKVNEYLRQYRATPKELEAHYHSSYVSMIISLNNMKDGQVGQHNHGKADTVRPDVTCLGLLLKARGEPMPSWWMETSFVSLRASEEEHLDFAWKEAAAMLLGLPSFPAEFANASWSRDGPGDSAAESDGVYPETNTPASCHHENDATCLDIEKQQDLTTSGSGGVDSLFDRSHPQ